MKGKSKEKEFFYEDMINALYDDFYSRQRERGQIERQWELNLNYLAGRQYCEIAANGEVEEEDKYYYWQDRNCYNHIAPIMDSRVARLTRVRPVMSVRASGSEESDVKTAKLTTAVLNSSYGRLNIDDEIFRATVWSETCGTAFYKVTWDNSAGRKTGAKDGKPVYEGDVRVEAVSPYPRKSGSRRRDFPRLRSRGERRRRRSVFVRDGKRRRQERIARRRFAD